ncbi:MAG: 4'-phosphopantetheinyl transferase family protein [Burkholderiaceae bacterium]
MAVPDAVPFARPAPHIAALFPDGVAAYEMKGHCTADGLFDSERACLSTASPRRIKEFASGRLCARAALSELGLATAPVLAGPDRAPIWPTGFAGSITHTEDYCVAVAAKLKRCEPAFRALGVDAEQVGAVTPDLWPQLMLNEEVRFLRHVSEAERNVKASLIFSAKEAFYKAQYPLTNGWINFDEVAVELGNNSFVVTIRNTELPIATHALTFGGRFWVGSHEVVTALAI